MRFLLLIPVNLRRHRGRAGIGIAGIAFGVAAMLTVLSIVTGAIGMFEHILSTDSDYLVFEKNTPDLFFSSVRADELQELRHLPNVASARPLLFGVVSSPGYPVITCFGLADDDPRLVHAQWLSGNASEFGHGANEIYLGSRAAKFLGAQQGATIPIGPTHFRVGGVLKLQNGFEDGGVFLPLADAQAFFHRPSTYSVVAVKLQDRSGGAVFRGAVDRDQPRLEAAENREFDQSYNSFRILRATSWAVGSCAFLLGGLGVANTMLMSVFSRIREIAVLRVCGFSRGQIAALVFGEAVAVAVIGLLVGCGLGLALLNLLPLVPRLQGYVQPRVGLEMLLGVSGLAVVTAVLGSLYPAHFASRIQPADALRYE